MASNLEDDDDDEFADYNPHPYKGGYDIALTYGHPLPPSPSTCYPISPHSTPSPPPPPPSLPLPPPPESDRRLEPYSPPPESDRRLEPYAPPPPESDHRPLYGYGESGYRPVECSPPPGSDLFGFWPFLTPADDERMGSDAAAFMEEVGYWNQWKRAGDYLFGYTEGYGERRIGVDSYGIPIYANKKEPTESLTFEIEPPSDQRLDLYESDRWFLSDIGKKDESYGYAYNKHHYQESLHVQEVSSEPVLQQRLTYHDVCEEKQTLYDDESNFRGTGQYAYEGHYEGPPLSFQLEPYRSTWTQNPGYRESQCGTVSLPSNWQTSDGCGDERNIYGNVQYSYERHCSEQPLCVELEPYKPTWYQNLCYHEFYGGATSFELDPLSSEGKGMRDESNTFGWSNHAYRHGYHEQPACEQLEPFKSAWSQNPTLYEPYIQDISQFNEVDDSKECSPDQYLSPFLKYLEYEDYSRSI